MGIGGVFSALSGLFLSLTLLRLLPENNSRKDTLGVGHVKSGLATDSRVSASTQIQALNALLFLLHESFSIGTASSARPQPRVPALRGRHAIRTILLMPRQRRRHSSANHNKVNGRVEGLAAASTSADRDRLRVVGEIGHQTRQCLAAGNFLTS